MKLVPTCYRIVISQDYFSSFADAFHLLSYVYSFSKKQEEEGEDVGESVLLRISIR